MSGFHTQGVRRVRLRASGVRHPADEPGVGAVVSAISRGVRRLGGPRLYLAVERKLRGHHYRRSPVNEKASCAGNRKSSSPRIRRLLARRASALLSSNPRSMAALRPNGSEPSNCQHRGSATSPEPCQSNAVASGNRWHGQEIAVFHLPNDSAARPLVHFGTASVSGNSDFSR